MSFFEKIEEPMMKVGDKLNNVAFLRILRDAFMVAFPLTIFGSITLIIANFPGLANLIGDEAAGTLNALLGPASTATMSIATVFVVLGIGYYFSKEHDCDPIFGAVIALSAFLLVTAMEKTMTVDNMMIDGVAQESFVVSNVFDIDLLGARSMFVGMGVAFLAGWLYCWTTAKNWVIKMPDSVPPAVSKSFSALIPACITLAVFLIIRIIFNFTPYGTIQNLVYDLLQAPLTGLGSGLGATLIAIFFVQLLWFFGLHGQIIVNSVMDPIWNVLTLDNLAVFKEVGHTIYNGAAITTAEGTVNAHIVTKQFLEIFTVGIGGSGMTLAVVVMMIFLLKSKQLKSVGKLAAPAGIFNVNEPVIFGLPIVLNASIAIPWILAPIINVCICYFAMASGLVPLTTGITVPWTTPILISGFLATNSWQGAVLQIVEFLVVFVVWFPFMKALDRQTLAEEAEEAAEEAAMANA